MSSHSETTWVVRLGRGLSAAVFAILAGGVAACGGSSEGGAGDTTILVFAAASLTDAFTALEVGFEADHPGLDVQLNLAGSTALRTQILDGAPADVFASANRSTMDQLVAENAVIGTPSVFATNRLAIAVPIDNPGRVTGLDDFARPELFIGLCLPEVPCGALAERAFVANGIVPSVDSFEPDVRALLTKVEEAEFDAGLVYVTDIIGSSSAVAVDIGANLDVARYPIGVLEGSAEPEVADRFVAYVLGPGGQATLASFGFGQP